LSNTNLTFAQNLEKMNRIDKIKAFLAESPKDSFLTFALAKEYEKLGDKKLALEQYLTLIENDPNYVGTYYHLGKLYEQLEEYATAFQTYKDGMKITRAAGDQHAFSELAGAKLNLGDDEDFE